MALTPPQYKQMKQFLESDQRVTLEDGGMLVKPGFGGTRQGYKEDSLSAKILKEKLPQYFSKSGAQGTGARKILEVNTVKKILNLYQKEKLGRDAIAKILADEGTPIPRTNIGRILKDAKEAKLIKEIPQKEMKASLDKRITPVGEKRKILEIVRPVTDFDRKNPQINAPKNATHKVVYYIPENPETSVIPKKFQGVQYYKSEEAAKNALKEKQNLNINQLKYKPQDNAVKSIHRIALKDADEIGNVNELAKMVYGNDNLKNLQNISNDLIRYQQALLGFKNIKGFNIPKKEILDDILSSFPSEGEYSKFASGAIRKAKLQIRDELLKTKGTKLINLRDNVLKLIDTNALNLDEVMGVSATFEKAPGYTELGQVINKEINKRKGTEIDRPFVKLFEKVINGNPNPTITYKGKTIDVNDFNKISKNFAVKNKIETPTIVYKPGEKLDASKFINSFSDLSPEAQKNIQDVAKKGVVLPSKAKPISVIEKELIATLSKDPRCRINRFKGGRVGLQDGSASLDVCFRQGVDNINRGLPNPTPAQARNFGKVAALGRGVLKFGVLPEAIFVAGESVLRMGMGDTLPEAIARASEYLLPFNQTKLADRMMLARTVGPKTAELILKANELRGFENQIENLKNEKQFTGVLTDDGFDDNFFGQTKVEEENAIQKRIDALKKRRESYGALTEAQYQFADAKAREAEDIKKSRAFFPKLLAKARSVEPDFDDPLREGVQQTLDLNLKMLPSRFQRQTDLFYRSPDVQALVNTPDQQLSNLFKGQDLENIKQLKIDTKNQLAETVSEAAAINPEAMFSASTGLFAPPLDLGVSYTPPPIDSIDEMEKEIIGQTNVANPFDLDTSNVATGLRGFSAAGGGIAKLAGVDSGPPPSSGPNSQGLQGLMKRVRNR